jgi:hypothetical protein
VDVVLDGTGLGILDVTLTPWEADESQRLLADIELPTAILDVLAAVETPPDGTVLLRRLSETYPAPTLTAGRPVDWLPTSTVSEEWGRPQVIVAGRDMTYVRGVATQLGEAVYSEPFGDEQITVTFPAVTGFDDGTGLEAIFDGRAGKAPYLSVWRILPDGSRYSDPIFEGLVTDFSQTSRGLVLEVSSPTAPAELAQCQPSTSDLAVDVGIEVPRKLNAVVGRRHHWIRTVATGITTRDRGTLADRVLDHCQDLLATATDKTTLRQWTVNKVPGGGRRYVVTKKNRTTVNWTVRYGQRGVEANLSRDLRDLPNVIYGYGIDYTGCAWSNAKFPHLHPDDSTPFPFTNPADVITVGDTDADTDSGTGVSDWQRRAHTDGYDVTVTGTYSADDRDECKRLQKAAGILVDGIIGGQTWAATFEVGSNVGDFDGFFVMPLAFDPRVIPRLYKADGGDAGPNPAYDPSILRVEETVAFGEGVGRGQAINEAQTRIDRYLDDLDGLYGEITFDADPQEGSRWDIRAGHNIKLKGYQGSDVVLHVSQAFVTVGGSTRVVVDTQARDALTLDQVRQRNEEAKNPAKRPSAKARKAQAALDPITAWDCESGAGVVPKHALHGGLWDVRPIPASFAGRILKVELTTSGPAAKFYAALFSKPIQPAQLVTLVGNPNVEHGTYGPWDNNADDLDDAGLLMSWGMPGQACGYYPGTEDASQPLTGRFVDTGGIDYHSDRLPWVWLALYSPTSTFIEGRLYSAPVTTV